MANFKGIYYNEDSSKVYFVNGQDEKNVKVSTVLTNYFNGMVGVLDDNLEIPIKIFKTFKFSGDYTREMINN